MKGTPDMRVLFVMKGSGKRDGCFLASQRRQPLPKRARFIDNCEMGIYRVGELVIAGG